MIQFSHPKETLEERKIFILAKLVSDLLTAEDCISEVVSFEMEQQQIDALVSLVYNIGCYNFQRSSFARLLDRIRCHPSRFQKTSVGTGERFRRGERLLRTLGRQCFDDFRIHCRFCTLTHRITSWKTEEQKKSLHILYFSTQQLLVVNVMSTRMSLFAVRCFFTVTRLITDPPDCVPT